MSRKRSHTLRKWLITLPLLLGLSLLGISQAKAKPKWSLRLLLSPYRKYRRYIDAMAKHESGYYKNTLSTKYNNIFSMGYPTVRQAANEGKTPILIEGIHHSVYKNYDQAIKDLLLWFDYFDFPKGLSNLESFVETLRSRGYFTDTSSNYINGLRRWI